MNQIIFMENMYHKGGSRIIGVDIYFNIQFIRRESFFQKYT